MEKSIKCKGFDAESFLENYPNASKKYEDRHEKSSLYSEYSLPWNYDTMDPPFPEMELNSCNVRWEPINIDEFIPKFGEEFKRFKVDYIAERSKARTVPSSKGQNKKTKVKKTSQNAAESGNAPQQKVNVVTDVDTPVVTTIDPGEGKGSTGITTNEASDSHQERVSAESETVSRDEATTNENQDVSATITEMTITDPVTSADIAKVSNSGTDEKKPSIKTTRISAKMRRASRADFHDSYLVKTDTKGGKPITIAPDLIERAYRICIRSGDYKACPTYLFNNLLREVLDFIEPDTEEWAALD